MPLYLQTNSRNNFVRRFLESIDILQYKMNRDHKILILTCYIDFRSIKLLARSIMRTVRVTEIELAFEFMESFRNRLPNETLISLRAMQTYFGNKEIKFTWHGIKFQGLMHAKGYAVIQLHERARVPGVVAIGSVNATAPGLGLTNNSNTNIELMQLSTDEADVNNFCEIWELICANSKDLSLASRLEDEYSFRYSLLSSGVFLHEWKNSWRSQVAIVYQLTEKGKDEIIINDTFSNVFSLEQATASRNPLNEINVTNFRPIPNGFKRKYLIDTLTGLWCPKSVWQLVEETIEFDSWFSSFKDAFSFATSEEKLDKIVDIEAQLMTSITMQGFIERDDERVTRWRKRVEELRNNDALLKHIFVKFSYIELPYSYEQKKEINNLWDSMMLSMNNKHTVSFVAKKVIAAVASHDIESLNLEEDESSDLYEELELS